MTTGAGEKARPVPFEPGMSVGLHGSWHRTRLSGCQVAAGR
jgi:hypothetical protein